MPIPQFEQNRDLSQEEVQELTIKYLKRELNNPGLTEIERNAREAELKKATAESEKLKRNVFTRLIQSDGPEAREAIDYATGNQFQRLLRRY